MLEERRTRTGVEAVIRARNLNRSLALNEGPVLGASTVAVVTIEADIDEYSTSARTNSKKNVHLDGGAVRKDTTLDIETLGSVAVRVNLYAARRWGWRRRRRGTRARRPWREWELELAVRVVDTVSGLLVVRVDVCEPANTAADGVLEVGAVAVEELIVRLLVRNVSNSVRAVGLHARGGHGGPAVLDQIPSAPVL